MAEDEKGKRGSRFVARIINTLAIAMALILIVLAFASSDWQSRIALSIAAVAVAFLVKIAEKIIRNEIKAISEMKKEGEVWGPVDVIRIVVVGILFFMAIIFIAAWAVLLASFGLAMSFAAALIISLIIGLMTALVIMRTAAVVPNRPHSLGIITIFGSKTEYEVKDGKYPTVPGILNYLIVKAQKVDQDFDK